MTISTGVQAVAEGKYGRTDEALWYVDRIVRTFNRVSPGSISEMMPDYGCFTIAWTGYGIVLPLIEHVFGVRPDAANRTIVFEPHLPAGWEDISIENLPVGANLVSFSRTRTGKGVVYDIEARENAWSFVLKRNRFARHEVFPQREADRSCALRHPHGGEEEPRADHLHALGRELRQRSTALAIGRAFAPQGAVSAAGRCRRRPHQS